MRIAQHKIVTLTHLVALALEMLASNPYGGEGRMSQGRNAKGAKKTTIGTGHRRTSGSNQALLANRHSTNDCCQTGSENSQYNLPSGRDRAQLPLAAAPRTVRQIVKYLKRC